MLGRDDGDRVPVLARLVSVEILGFQVMQGEDLVIGELEAVHTGEAAIRTISLTLAGRILQHDVAAHVAVESAESTARFRFPARISGGGQDGTIVCFAQFSPGHEDLLERTDTQRRPYGIAKNNHQRTHGAPRSGVQGGVAGRIPAYTARRRISDSVCALIDAITIPGGARFGSFAGTSEGDPFVKRAAVCAVHPWRISLQWRAAWIETWNK